MKHLGGHFITSKIAVLGNKNNVISVLQVLCRGQTIGAIVARSQTEALEAADAVQVVYEPLPAIISIQVIV